MDSIPQELIDAFIDNVPKSSIPPCSLVARRWRRKSQKRALASILFASEREVKRWCTDVPRDSDGISSYVRRVAIYQIVLWVEPALLSQMLGSLGSLTTLSMFATQIPDELPGHISRGEFGKGITALYLGFPNGSLEALMSMIHSLPDLKELCAEHCVDTPKELLPTHPVTPLRRPLDWLKLHGNLGGIGEALTKSRFISSRLSLDVGITNIGQLLLLSSEMVVELKLRNIPASGIPPPIHLPPLLALTTLAIDIDAFDPSPHLTNILFSIDSAPALESITIDNPSWKSMEHPSLWASWVDMDRRLSRIAKQTKATGGLSLTLRRWPEGESVWEGFLPEFRESGGKIKVDDSRQYR